MRNIDRFFWSRALAIASIGLLAIACSPDDDNDDTDSGAKPAADAGGIDAVLTPPPFSFAQGSTAIDQSGSFHLPGNERTSTTKAWDSAVETFTLTNDSGGTISVTSVSITPDSGTVDEEFTVEDKDGKALDVKDLDVDNGGKFSFNVRFRPVVGGDRSAMVNLVWDGNKLFQFTVKGKGTGDSSFWPLTQADREHVVGTPAQDELLSTMVADTEGNLYYAANVIGLADTFNYDVLIGRLNADGSAGWNKVFNGPNRDFAPDAGGNADTGGTAGSLAWHDGALYFIGATSVSKANAKYRLLVLKIDPATGAMTWQKAWEPDKGVKPAKNSAKGGALDARGKYLLITGQAPKGALVAALDKKDGSFAWTRVLEMGGTDVGWTIRGDGQGGAWVGADSDGDAVLAHLTDVDSEPKLNLIQKVSFGDGTRINDLSVDGSGNAYLSLGPAGVKGRFAAARVGLDGKVAWTKSFPGGASGPADTHVVHVVGDWLYVAGRIGLADYDNTDGDGLITKLAVADGDPAWAAFYHSGPGAERAAQHRIKGLAMVGDHLYIGQQAVTAAGNSRRYKGYFYLAPAKAKDDTLTLSDHGGATLSAHDTGASEDGSDHGAWVDAPKELVAQPAANKGDGEAPDADVLLSRIPL